MFNFAFVIDDSPIDLMLTSVVIQKKLLTQKVKNFNSGVAALAYLKENANNEVALPDVIFLDIYMPLMDGFSFLDSFLELNWPPENMPLIVFVSSTINDYDFQKMEHYNSIRKHFVSKPITMDAVAELIEKMG